MIDSFLWLMFQKLKGLVVGASHKFEGGINSIILIICDNKLSVSYVFRHIFCSVIKYYRKSKFKYYIQYHYFNPSSCLFKRH